MSTPSVHSHTYTLTAAQCCAQREMPPAQTVQRIIEVATEHADLLGVGYRTLSLGGCLWVLSRVALEMNRYPAVGETFTINTWIENFNRHFSQRNFDITSADGTVLGYARTIWVAIDMTTRRPANLSSISAIASTVIDRPCPIAPPSKIHPVTEASIVNDYTIRVADIDFNRHLTSSRYVELVIDQMDLDFYDAHFVSRLEIEYRRETHYGSNVAVSSALSADGRTITTTISQIGRAHV